VYLHFFLDQSVFTDRYKNMTREAAADHRTGNCWRHANFVSLVRETWCQRNIDFPIYTALF